MKLMNLISFVDTHAAGCPIRILTGGLPTLRGNTMLEKMLDMQNRYDHLRSATMCEPRGHRQMVGAVLTEPISPNADVGVFYIDPKGYAPMCGAGSIALSRALIEMGLVPMEEPVTRIRMDTPSGIVDGFAQVENGAIGRAWFQNIDSFVYSRDLIMNWQGKEISFDILYGGNFFVSVPIAPFGLELIPEHADRIAGLGMDLLAQINRQVRVSHPKYPGITFLNDIQFTQPPYQEDGRDIYRNTVVFGAGQVDRSPCGTGTCARMASLYTQGLLQPGEEFIHESILGSRFTGKIVQVREESPYPAVTCQLGGETYIVSMGQFLLDKDDPLRYGFLV